jgi:hypothetical protein
MSLLIIAGEVSGLVGVFSVFLKVLEGVGSNDLKTVDPFLAFLFLALPVCGIVLDVFGRFVVIFPICIWFLFNLLFGTKLN